MQRARADQDRDFLAGVQNAGGAPQVGVVRRRARPGEADARMQGPVLARRALVRHVLQVVGKHQRRHTALAERDADRAVDEVAHLRRGCGLLHKGAGDVLVHAAKIEFLLVVAAHGGARLLSGDRQHGHVVHTGVVESGDQMRRARSRCRQADAEMAREFGVGAGHERGHFLVANLDQFDLAVRPVQGLDYPVDAVAGIAEYFAHAPGVQPLDNEISNSLTHFKLQ